jgi:hypothetical protein
MDVCRERNMDPAVFIAAGAGLAVAISFFGLLSRLWARRAEEERVQDYLKERDALRDRRLAVLRKKRERIRGIREVLEAEAAARQPPPAAGASVLVADPSGAGPGGDPLLYSFDAKAILKRAQDDPQEAATIVRILLRDLGD